jgi:hypothetical protein
MGVGPAAAVEWITYFCTSPYVGASAEALAGSAGLSGSAFAMVTPDAVLRRLAVAPLLRGLGDAAPHFYAFGGLAAAARWAAAVAAGRITLDHHGFSVEPS